MLYSVSDYNLVFSCIVFQKGFCLYFHCNFSLHVDKFNMVLMQDGRLFAVTMCFVYWLMNKVGSARGQAEYT